MARKKVKKIYTIPLTILIGLVVVILFWYIYGWLLLLRYLLGSIMFATVTVGLITFIKRRYGKKRVRWL